MNTLYLPGEAFLNIICHKFSQYNPQ